MTDPLTANTVGPAYDNGEEVETVDILDPTFLEFLKAAQEVWLNTGDPETKADEIRELALSYLNGEEPTFRDESSPHAQGNGDHRLESASDVLETAKKATPLTRADLAQAAYALCGVGVPQPQTEDDHIEAAIRARDAKRLMGRRD